MQIDRSLKDETMDAIDHALGRPLDPLSDTYRNFYATDGAQADAMAASPFWMEGRRGIGMRCFAVTNDGRKALAEHLRKIGDPHRAFSIVFDGHERTVAAASRSRARYSHYLGLRDVLPDLTFQDFCRRSSITLKD